LSNRDAGNIAGKPKAWLNMVLLDEQLKPVITQDGKNSYFQQVGADTILTVLGTTDRQITKSGYLYIYVSNETQNIDVFFDNLQVTHTRGPLLSSENYYPYGLTMSGISGRSAGKLENRFRFNGKRLESNEFADGSGLDWYDYGMREYDHQVGRFFRVDPLSEKFYYLTPYQYASNNPATNIDLDGLEGTPIQAFTSWLLGKVIKNPNGAAAHTMGVLVGVDKSLKKTVTGVVHVVTHPVSTIKAVAELGTIQGKIKAEIGIAKAINDKIEEFKQGSAPDKTAIITEGSVDVFTMIVGTKGIGVGAKGAATTATLAADVARGAEVATVAADVAKGTEVAAGAANAAKTGANIGTKLEYVFGKATGSAHNIERSTGMLRQLESVGIFDNAAGRSLLNSHLESVYSGTKGILQSNGRYLRESLLMGPRGGLKVESIWDENKLITVKLLGGK